MKLTAGIKINASTEEVWNVISSPAALALWQDGYQSTVMIHGDPGAESSQANHAFEEKGKKVQVSEKVVSLTPMSERTSELEYPVMTQHVKATLQGEYPVNLTFDVQVTMKAFSLKLFSRWLRKSFQEKLQADLERLKQAVEPAEPAH